MVFSSFNSFKIILILLVAGWFLYFPTNIALSTSSPDAIAVRVIPNPGHHSVMRWYQDQGFTGSPQSILVDGYEAIRDGRTVYVNAANMDLANNVFYTNIYLISYNQEAEQATQDIFGQMISHWQFNTNLAKGKTISGQDAVCSQDSSIICISDVDCIAEGYCNSFKSQVTRDTIRLARMNDIDVLLENYSQNMGHYPKLTAGTYLPNITISAWPSWQDTLGQSLGSTLSIDPINQLASCPDDYDSATCWNEQTKEFKWTEDIKEGTLPANNFVFLYQTDEQGANYKLCAFSETGLIEEAKSCNSECIPICFDKECGDNSCGSVCLPGCSPMQTCLNGICYTGCNTGPGCRDNLTNGHVISGYCPEGNCYQCDYGYGWEENSCVPVCTPTCITGPGCRISLANGQTTTGDCCGNGQCYTCKPGYSWDANNKICIQICTPTCSTGPGCRTALANGQITTGDCCGNDQCYECQHGYGWNGIICVENCYSNCTTGPGCRISSPIHGQIVSGDCCGNGQCYGCVPGYAWDDQTNTCVCAPTCSTGPGCRFIGLNNGFIIGGPEQCCGSGNCYDCATGYAWDSESESCVCAPTCSTGPGCRDSLTNGVIIGETDQCCGNGFCYDCTPSYSWNGINCECVSFQVNEINNATFYVFPVGVETFYYSPARYDKTATVNPDNLVTYQMTINPVPSPEFVININSVDGEIHGVATNNTDAGIYIVSVIAENSCGSSDTEEFVLKLEPNGWCGDGLCDPLRENENYCSADCQGLQVGSDFTVCTGMIFQPVCYAGDYTTPKYNWSFTSESGTSQQEGFVLQIDDNYDFSSPEISILELMYVYNFYTIEEAGLTSGNIYYSRLKIKDNHGTWSDWVRFDQVIAISPFCDE